MKPKVSLLRTPNYDRKIVESHLRRLLAPLGGMESFVRPGQKVLVKPNMLSGKSPERAVTTHPEVVRGIVQLAQEAGGRVFVGDSPGVGSPRQVARRSGILAVIEETGAEFASFSDSVRIRPRGGTFHELEIARDILDADVIINLPKLKTHQMMGLTGGVKNLFGAVVGMRKPRLHLQAGTDKAFFALMLLELAEQVAPALTVVDAIIGMEGEGPGSGDPITLGALIAGASPLAVDAAAIAMLGISPQDVWTQAEALRTGRPGSRIEEVEILGDSPEDLRPSRFRSAGKTDVNFGLPPFLKNPLKKALTARPVVDPILCEHCGLCVEHCPPRAMAISGESLRIDDDRCIRCFCCQELCPRGALPTRQGLLLRLSEFLNKK